MANLLELSRKLRVRAENLLKELSESGLGEYTFEENLPTEIVEFLEHQFSTGRRKGWIARFGDLFAFTKRPKSSTELVDKVENMGDRSETDGGHPRISSAKPATGHVEKTEGSSRLEPSGQPKWAMQVPEADYLDLLSTPDELQSDSAGPTFESEAIPLEPPAEPRGQESAPTPSSVVAPTPREPLSEAPETEVPAGLDPNLLIASLETIEKIRGKLGGEKIDPFGKPAPIEPPQPEQPLSPLVSKEEQEALPEYEPTPYKEEINSAQLQAMVDELAKGLPDTEHPPIVERIPVFYRIASFLPSFQLDLKEKFTLAAALVMAASLIGGALLYRGTNYGAGGDRRLYEEGLANMRDRRFDAALKSFNKVVARYPDSPLVLESRSRMAAAYKERGDLNGAVREMRQGLALQSRILGAATAEWSEQDLAYRRQGLFFLGEVSAEKEEWEGAADWFSQVLEGDPPEAVRQRALYRLADAMYHREEGQEVSPRIRELIAVHENAIGASPESEWTDTALSRLSALWERLASMELGIRKENLEKALEYVQRINQKSEGLTGKETDRLALNLRIGLLLRELGRVEESVSLFRGLLNAPPEPEEDGSLPFAIVSGLARSLLARAEVAGVTLAETDLFEVLELSRNREDDPLTEEELTEALYLRGHANYQLGVLNSGKMAPEENPFFERMDNAYQGALARHDQYGPREEDSLLAMMRRTNYLFQINQDYRDAVRSYRQLLEKFPSSIYSYRVRYRLGTALFQLGEYKEAEELFQQVVDQFGETRYVDDDAFRDSYFRLGHCQFLLKDYMRAADTIKTLLRFLDYEESPDALSAWRLLAESYYAQGLYDQAVVEYRSYLSRYPNQDSEGKIRLALGRTLIARFDYEEGRQELRHVVRTCPLSESARLARYFLCESYLSEQNLAHEETRAKLLREALAEANSLRASYPAEDTPLYLLGRIQFLLGDYERASRDLEYFCNAAQGQRPLALAQLLLGEAYYNLKKYSKAADQLARIDLSELPREEAARALYLLAEAQRFDQQFQQAVDSYGRLAKDYPSSPFSELVQGRIEEVQWRLKKGI